jgi:hypothetical protein
MCHWSTHSSGDPHQHGMGGHGRGLRSWVDDGDWRRLGGPRDAGSVGFRGIWKSFLFLQTDDRCAEYIPPENNRGTECAPIRVFVLLIAGMKNSGVYENYISC